MPLSYCLYNHLPALPNNRLIDTSNKGRLSTIIGEQKKERKDKFCVIHG